MGIGSLGLFISAFPVLSLSIFIALILLFIYMSGMIRYIPNNQLGVLEKLWSSGGSIDSGLTALKSEAGASRCGHQTGVQASTKVLGDDQVRGLVSPLPPETAGSEARSGCQPVSDSAPDRHVFRGPEPWHPPEMRGSGPTLPRPNPLVRLLSRRPGAPPSRLASRPPKSTRRSRRLGRLRCR